ncbi:fumarate hydratase [Halanaerobacter jeridensis]|uniref:Fumarate hydratase subunit alpha n=1 Tax=Halanaerobacter jeridensis TaxID=706427 RepID=A0A938XVR4_9FIRM|nr:fumarate hydratase [Halanaerobacter jeridensis]MBM7556140.1 fumarate hydratase subunit alpha [Halanaerobacter jeridensis]
MRTIEAEEITKAVARLCKETNYNLGQDVIRAYKESLAAEESEVAQEILEQLIQNAEIAQEKEVPICQDTGMAVVFLELGQDVNIVGDDVTAAVNEGVKKGYQEGYLRKSVVSDPLIERKNTEDNTPAVIHTTIVPGDELKITVAPKGFGSENMSQMKMFNPTAGAEKVKDFVVQVVEEAGPNPCPPIVVGVGVGGTLDKAALLAKKSLLRDIGEHNSDPKYKSLEEEILNAVNETGVGPQGLGGKTTALAVNIEEYPTHIAGLPVVVNINCHVARHKTVVL